MTDIERCAAIAPEQMAEVTKKALDALPAGCEVVVLAFVRPSDPYQPISVKHGSSMPPEVMKGVVSSWCAANPRVQ